MTSIEPPNDPATIAAWHQMNRASWNEAADHYTRRIDDTVAFLRAGHSNLHAIERAAIGPLRPWCQVAIHLQCASGRDTLSLWNEGASRVIGLDISDVQIANAQRTSDALGAPATWYRCDILDAPRELDNSADLVHTGRGALNWIFDLEAWARVVARLLKPGGIVHIFDDHPVIWLFDETAETLVPSGFDYFHHVELSRGWPTSYIADLLIPDAEQAPKYDRVWTLADLVVSLRHAGLTIEHLGEHRETYRDAFSNLRPELQGRIPLTFSVVAKRVG
jgi:SAM-dependent methyltransferase